MNYYFDRKNTSFHRHAIGRTSRLIDQRWHATYGRLRPHRCTPQGPPSDDRDYVKWVLAASDTSDASRYRAKYDTTNTSNRAHRNILPLKFPFQIIHQFVYSWKGEWDWNIFQDYRLKFYICDFKCILDKLLCNISEYAMQYNVLCNCYWLFLPILSKTQTKRKQSEPFLE